MLKMTHFNTKMELYKGHQIEHVAHLSERTQWYMGTWSFMTASVEPCPKMHILVVDWWILAHYNNQTFHYYIMRRPLMVDKFCRALFPTICEFQLCMHGCLSKLSLIF